MISTHQDLLRAFQYWEIVRDLTEVLHDYNGGLNLAYRQVNAAFDCYHDRNHALNFENLREAAATAVVDLDKISMPGMQTDSEAEMGTKEKAFAAEYRIACRNLRYWIVQLILVLDYAFVLERTYGWSLRPARKRDFNTGKLVEMDQKAVLSDLAAVKADSPITPLLERHISNEESLEEDHGVHASGNGEPALTISEGEEDNEDMLIEEDVETAEKDEELTDTITITPKNLSSSTVAAAENGNATMPHVRDTSRPKTPRTAELAGGAFDCCLSCCP